MLKHKYYGKKVASEEHLFVILLPCVFNANFGWVIFIEIYKM